MDFAQNKGIKKENITNTTVVSDDVELSDVEHRSEEEIYLREVESAADTPVQTHSTGRCCHKCYW